MVATRPIAWVIRYARKGGTHAYHDIWSVTSGLKKCATTNSLQFSDRYCGQRLTGRAGCCFHLVKRGNERPSI